ncbi:MAG: DUF1592 domain-containing protein [Pseudomonadales bacterium]|nr:DUF1592 domain-containing protein [Pseudomonadales bacterium]
MQKLDKSLYPRLLLSLLALVPGPVLAQVPVLLDTYCVECHNFEDWAGSLDLESLNFEHVGGDANTWEKVVRKIRTGMMPPSGQERPPRAELDQFAGTVEQRLDAAVSMIPAAPALHRLNRNEYARAIRDLLALDVDVSQLLPLDDASEGFDNMASTLGFSPALVQGYTAAAMKISRWAVGDMSTTEASTTYAAPAGLAQDRHLDGMPLGSRGGLKINHDFPLDAEYDFSIRGGFGFGRNGDTAFDISLDGAHLPVANPRSFRLPVTAGTHTLTVTIMDLRHATGVDAVYAQYSVPGGVNTIEITGPFNASGPGMTASREQVFVCYPASNDEEAACAGNIISGLARRAFRQPVTSQDIAAAMAFYRRGYQEGGFENGIQQALSRILIDPRFLFRFEEEPAALAAGESYAISDLELASRLSFFLWSSIPDETLLSLAENGRLRQPEILEQQVKRMLRDPKAMALVDNFASQWLYLRQLQSLTPETDAFDENLRQAFTQETRLLVASIINEDRNVTELLNADYTFLNERLARHYGIADVRGSYFRRVELAPDSPRRGLLGQGSILTVTSSASRTSPVIRGSWILENLLHAPVPDPPPGVETNLDGDGTTVLTTSVRERLEAHRADPACASCHSVIDPVGFALENFDLIGAWREYDGDSAVDASGVLTDGSPIAGPGDLRAALLARSGVFVSTLTEKLLAYALGRDVHYYDMPAIRAIIRDAQPQNYPFSALVLGIVNSEQFLYRSKSAEPASSTAVR